MLFLGHFKTKNLLKSFKNTIISKRYTKGLFLSNCLINQYNVSDQILLNPFQERSISQIEQSLETFIKHNIPVILPKMVFKRFLTFL